MLIFIVLALYGFILSFYIFKIFRISNMESFNNKKIKFNSILSKQCFHLYQQNWKDSFLIVKYFFDTINFLFVAEDNFELSPQEAAIPPSLY